MVVMGLGLLSLLCLYILLAMFFDQGKLIRKNTLYRLSSKPSAIMLTFDDGPHPIWTPQLLEVLKRHDVPAVFFVVGSLAEKRPDLIRNMIEEGHTVGNHSYSHRPIWKLSKQQVCWEIETTERIISKAAGCSSMLFRPPKGFIRPSQKRLLEQMGYQTVTWSLSPKDWVGFSARYLVSTVLRRVRGGDIILFHDGGGVCSLTCGKRANTITAVERLIVELKRQGYHFESLKQNYARVKDDVGREQQV
jgi:peptidoglycan/xylan/chitin deacetylase (PgdA/CDA1 family)